MSKIWFKCYDCGHTFQATKRRKTCPKCKSRNIQPIEPKTSKQESDEKVENEEQNIEIEDIDENEFINLLESETTVLEENFKPSSTENNTTSKMFSQVNNSTFFRQTQDNSFFKDYFYPLIDFLDAFFNLHHNQEVKKKYSESLTRTIEHRIEQNPTNASKFELGILLVMTIIFFSPLLKRLVQKKKREKNANRKQYESRNDSKPKSESKTESTDKKHGLSIFGSYSE